MTETFNWDRKAGAVGKITYRVIETKFGDGYAQVVSEGLNTKSQSWPLTFEGNMTKIKPILDFLDRHRGSKSFFWTPPGESSPLYFRAAEISLTSIQAGVYQLSVEFKQVFYP